MSELLILTSPPASGKTFWIDSFSAALEETLLVISPLRALADECKKNWGDRISVMTPEEWLKTKTHASVVIFDEFHLLWYWGDSFRPLLWEAFLALSSGAWLVVGLTATLSTEIKNQLESFSTGFDNILWCDHGNQKLKWTPREYLHLSRELLEKSLLHLSLPRTSLVFCAYREEVELWEKRFRDRGLIAWGCRGGEAKTFAERVRTESPPDVIIATTVLSHGVNLPTIRRVYFLYAVQNVDFWIQMVARGGRRGEAFEVFALEPPVGLRWSRWRNLVGSFSLRLEVFFSLILDQIDACFLKD